MSLALWMWCWLAGAAELYPPDDSILLQQSRWTRLSWDLPGQNFDLEVSSQGRIVERSRLTFNYFELKVAPGQSYNWSVRSDRGSSHAGHFEVAATHEFHCDGQTGTGEPGGRVEARLERGNGRMQLFLSCPHHRLHYVFADAGVKFLISARGGKGRPGAPGLDVPNNPCHPGHPGGPGGWGGEVRISTLSVPWRDYLRVDVSGGEGGPGGRGGRALFSHVSGYDSPRPIGPTGPPGQPGRTGTVVTRIVQP
ncbi:MAG: hypothetical protein U0931_24815 [Vulcanimicrobiota bacterium]